MAVSGQHWLEEGPLCELLLVANEPQEKQGKSMQKPSLAVLSSVFLCRQNCFLRGSVWALSSEALIQAEDMHSMVASWSHLFDFLQILSELPKRGIFQAKSTSHTLSLIIIDCRITALSLLIQSQRIVRRCLFPSPCRCHGIHFKSLKFTCHDSPDSPGSNFSFPFLFS